MGCKERSNITFKVNDTNKLYSLMPCIYKANLDLEVEYRLAYCQAKI